jgi:electron transport complex protein RnfB
VPFPASLAEALDRALPQTQCTRCGYADCRAYAEALADEAAEINRCPPGGAEGIRRLAALTGHAILPLDPDTGEEGPRRLAVIDEAACIGCTLCLPACPVDCIVGGPKRLHVVIEAHCTGCELCLPACPVDCIVMQPASGERTGWDAWSATQADDARRRYRAHRDRSAHTDGSAANPEPDAAAQAEAETRRRGVVAAALARARGASA